MGVGLTAFALFLQVLEALILILGARVSLRPLHKRSQCTVNSQYIMLSKRRIFGENRIIYF